MRGALRLAGWALLGALPWILLQLGHSYVLFTRYEYDLFGQEGYFNPLRSRWIDTLFSSWHGFLSWTPVAYLAVIGTVAYLRREWRWAAATLAILFAHRLGQRRPRRTGPAAGRSAAAGSAARW